MVTDWCTVDMFPHLLHTKQFLDWRFGRQDVDDAGTDDPAGTPAGLAAEAGCRVGAWPSTRRRRPRRLGLRTTTTYGRRPPTTGVKSVASCSTRKSCIRRSSRPSASRQLHSRSRSCSRTADDKDRFVKLKPRGTD